MASEDRAPEADAADSRVLRWWNVRRPGALHLYVGLCWGLAPGALIYLRDLIGHHIGVGLVIGGLVWTIGHMPLIAGVVRFRLIQRASGWCLFVVAVITATAGVGGFAIMAILPEIPPEILPMSSVKVVTTLPPLLPGALAWLSLSASRSGPRPHSPRP